MRPPRCARRPEWVAPLLVCCALAATGPARVAGAQVAGDTIILSNDASARGTRIAQAKGFAPDAGPAALAMKIANAVAIEPSFVVVPAGRVRVEGVSAGFQPDRGTRYLVYDQTFMDEVTRNDASDWRAALALAHAIGHHVSGHTLPGRRAQDEKSELEADRFAGYALARLGASLVETTNALDAIARRGGATAASPQRLSAVSAGWRLGGRDGISVTDLGGAAKPAPSAEDAVLAVLRRYHAAIASQDARELRLVFTDDAAIEVFAPGSATPHATYDAASAIGRIVGARQRMEQRSADEKVTVAGDSATVTARYTFYEGGRLSNCGGETYRLVNRGGGWRIAHLSDTQRIAAECKE